MLLVLNHAGTELHFHNPYLTNAFSHLYHSGEYSVPREFLNSIQLSMKILYANRIAPDGTPRSATSHLGLFCLPMSHKRDARLI